MFDLLHLSDYVLAAITCWIGYVHKQMADRPTREEVLLRQAVNEVIQKEIKDDISEIKADIKHIRDTLLNG